MKTTQQRKHKILARFLILIMIIGIIPSLTVSAMPVPGKPTLTSPSSVGVGTTTVSWNSVPNAYDYSVRVIVVETGEELLSRIHTTNRSFTFKTTSMHENQNIKVWIQAYNKNKVGGLSEERIFSACNPHTRQTNVNIAIEHRNWHDYCILELCN